jgi:zinc/manganese transport system substrate-binding protein/manganese/iron transport system substrate-binding protein
MPNRRSRAGRTLLMPVLALLLGLLPIPLHPPAIAQDDRPVVAVSTPLLADIVRNVAGDRAEVYSVMPETADPHTWEAAPEDIVRVGESDTFISMGANLELFIESGPWRRAVQDNGVPELVLADHLDLIEVDKVIDHGDHTHDLREGDPHVWLDPRMVMAAIPVIERHLAGIDPEGGATYAAAAGAYSGQVAALDAELARDLATIPAERRKLIVFHDAYTYFAARFGFEVIGVVLANPEVEISAREVVALQRTIEETGVRVIFAEPQFNTGILSVFVAENDVVVGELLTDAFAGRVTTYLDLMRFNRGSLVHHLGGTIAPGGTPDPAATPLATPVA